MKDKNRSKNLAKRRENVAVSDFTPDEVKQILPKLNRAACYREHIVRKRIVPFLENLLNSEAHSHSYYEDLVEMKSFLIEVSTIYEHLAVLLEAAKTDIITLEEQEKGILTDERYADYFHNRLWRYCGYPCTAHDLSDIGDTVRNKALMLKQYAETYRGYIPKGESLYLIRRDIVETLRSAYGVIRTDASFYRLRQLIETLAQDILWDKIFVDDQF